MYLQPLNLDIRTREINMASPELEIKSKLDTSASTQEEAILQLFKKDSEQKQSRENRWARVSADALLFKLLEIPFLSVSSDFLEKSKPFVNNPKWEAIKVWFLIAAYVKILDGSSPVGESLFVEITTGIDKLHKRLTNDDLAKDPKLVINLIRNIYLSNNYKLINLFSKYFPIPGRHIFGDEVPMTLLKKQMIKEVGLVGLLNKHGIIKTEKIATRLQRNFRFKKRKREDFERIKKGCDLKSELEKKGRVETILAETNALYSLKECSHELRTRVYAAAKQVVLFKTISHLTNETALESILNDGLFGRRTLNQFLLPYIPAALGPGDICRGDNDVICFGPNQIDPKVIARHWRHRENTIEVILDVQQLERDNPCIFYKQRDFGYDPQEVNNMSFIYNKAISLTAAGIKLSFLYTTRRLGTYEVSGKTLGCRIDKYNNLENSYFYLLDENGQVQAYAEVPYWFFISNNYREMHQILCLNFFRFVDALKLPNGEKAEQLIKSIYDKIHALSEKDLVTFLQELGKCTTQSAEFNFYGAYRINFSSIVTINALDQRNTHDYKKVYYSLNMREFINSLQAGDLKKLEEVRSSRHLPTLFKSYRFIDYLLENIKHDPVNAEVRKTLLNLRMKCRVPFWMMNLEKMKAAKPTGLEANSLGKNSDAHFKYRMG